MIRLKTPKQIEKIRESGRLASRALDFVGERLVPGITTLELDKLIHSFLTDRGAIPATLGYNGFPASSCISINEVVVHGIPDGRIVKDGDLVKIDVTAILDGYYGDTARTFEVGRVPDEGRRLAAATKESLDLAIKVVRPGARLGDIGWTIQSHVEARGFSVVRKFVGHGVGLHFHEKPQILHHGVKGSGLKIQSGMVFTIEPMINAGSHDVRILSDGWTAVTVDGRLSAQFEHTLAVTADGADVLTLS